MAKHAIIAPMTADTAAITRFAQQLVRTPSQGGIDSPAAIVNVAYDAAIALGLPVFKLLDDNGQPIAVVAEIKGNHPGKTWAVNATLDTAPAVGGWKGDPFSGEVKDGILHGRGAGDSKLAAAMFTHLAQDMLAAQQDMHGTFLLVLDGDEHTGNFGGIHAALKAGYKPDGIMIGYPGDDKIVIGGRGFSRYEITLNGEAQHSGATIAGGDNALVRAAGIITDLSQHPPATDTDSDFDKQPKVTVTGVAGGDGYSVVPSKATIKIDTRLTPLFNEAAADKYIRDTVAAHDAKNNVPASRATDIKKVSAEPPFLTPKQSELRRALADSILEITGKRVPEVIAGPSNIGNFLAKQGIEVTAGYGVRAKGVHSNDEQANLRQLPKVYDVYKKTLQKLLKITP